jgi:hypothetical protein
MPFTREQEGRAALMYVIVTVMNQPEDQPMAKSLTAAQIDNVEYLGTLLEADIENLSFIALIDADPTPMGPGQRGVLRAFIAFIRHRANEDNPIGDNWNGITREEEFNTYGVGPSFNGTIFGDPSASNPGIPSAPSTRARDAVADFKRGIKRDPSQFSILKDNKQWDGWNRYHNAQARAQGWNRYHNAQARAQGVVDVMNSTHLQADHF